jgi:ribokinase
MPAIVVVGSINRDIVARVAHLPTPGETVLAATSTLHPGGKGANQAVAATRLRRQPTDSVRLIGRVGRDGFGADMRALFLAEGIDASGVTDANVATGLAFITIDDHAQNMITVVSGANLDWPRACPPLNLAAGDIVICQLEIPLTIVTSAFAQARAAGATTLLNPAPFQPVPDNLLANTDVLVLNELELAQMLGRNINDFENGALIAAVHTIVAKGPRAVVVTLGGAGALLVEASGRAVHIPARAVQAVDTTGAGDCFVGAMAAALRDDDDLRAACDFANTAASLSVTRHGAASSMPTRADLT